MADLDTEDVRKIHAEVNQIVNQRFLLTTLAVTVFGVVAAWMLPRDSAKSEIDTYYSLIGAELLLVLLFLLYCASIALRNVLRTATSYLVVFEVSAWERRASAFRSDGDYSAYTKIQSIVFMALGLLDAVFFAMSSAFVPPSFQLVCALLLLAAYWLLIWGMGWRGWWDREKALLARWKKLRDDELAPTLKAPEPPA